ncbi:dihydrodipicolinate synthase family protein [Gallaecimonas sp. GXIMD4217]|uniref:dihydrodipicolinate synthase family protein n=1 Tax=Gallaecimonas sp. GXIMD4217 TaxID=3131927 RepID=UPI00311AFF23
MSIQWTGVMPAITTPFTAELQVDHEFLKRHVAWLVAAGSTAIIPCGSLGEGATLSFDEKVAVVKSCVEAAGEVPVMPGIAAMSTEEAVALARACRDVGAKGLMVLPPYVYPADWRELSTHMGAVIESTELPCILYNNPVAYGLDLQPAQIAELVERHAKVEAVKESSTDARRISAIRALIGDKVALGVGVDDCLLEGVACGARFWIAGLVNALPEESIRLYELAMAGRLDEAFELYAWFLPLLRLDTVPKFVQLIKLAQEAVGWGNEQVRPPRLPLTQEERAETLALIRHALDNRPGPGEEAA